MPNFPFAQSLHSVDAVGLVFPALHCLQLLASSDCGPLLQPWGHAVKPSHAASLHSVKYDPSGTSTEVVPPPRTIVPAPDGVHGSLRPGSADAVPAAQSLQSLRFEPSARPYFPGKHGRQKAVPFSDWYVPFSHATQFVVLFDLNPLSHSTHGSTSFSLFPTQPTGQTSQNKAASSETFPRGHSSQSLNSSCFTPVSPLSPLNRPAGHF